jgi:hypothetical protein
MACAFTFQLAPATVWQASRPHYHSLYMHMQELIEQLGQNQAQWLNGSMAQWLNGSMARWLNGFLLAPQH